jgi:hypothetical protein
MNALTSTRAGSLGQAVRTAIAIGIIIFAAAASLPAPAGDLAKRKAPVIPEACREKQGVELKMCLECSDVPIYRRPGCDQRVFWTTCKGKRLLTDEFCKTHEHKGPPQAVGG